MGTVGFDESQSVDCPGKKIVQHIDFHWQKLAGDALHHLAGGPSPAACLGRVPSPAVQWLLLLPAWHEPSRLLFCPLRKQPSIHLPGMWLWAGVKYLIGLFFLCLSLAGEKESEKKRQLPESIKTLRL